MGYYPIVSLDKIYLNKDNIIYLDCTRLDGSDTLVSRKNPNDINSVNTQIKNISEYLLSIGQNKILLVDDVVFSGNVIKGIINLFKSYGIEVVGIKAIISTIDSYEYFKILPLQLKCEYLMSSDVIDQICERDFYFGIAQAGISIKKGNTIYKAPYFLPFGNPVERASIPAIYENKFSYSCIKRSLELWSEIERLSGKTLYNRDLPEVIYNTNKDEEVVKTLKKELK